jgi:hypothetical protein
MELDLGIHIGSTWFVLETRCDIGTFQRQVTPTGATLVILQHRINMVSIMLNLKIFISNKVLFDFFFGQ